MTRFNELTRTDKLKALKGDITLFSDNTRVNEHDLKVINDLKGVKKEDYKELISIYSDLLAIKTKEEKFIKSIIAKIDEAGYYSTSTESELTRQIEYRYSKYKNQYKYYDVYNMKTTLNIIDLSKNIMYAKYKNNDRLQWMIKSITFKKDNIIKLSYKDHLYIISFLFNNDEQLKNNITKEYQNGSFEVQLNPELYEELFKIKTEPKKDDQKIIDFIDQNIDYIKSTNGYDHALYFKIIEAYKRINEIDSIDFINNYSIIEDHYKKALNK